MMKRRAFLQFVGGAAATGCLPTLRPAALLAAGAGAASAQPLYWSWWAWEPLDHYHRTNGIVGAVDCHAPWLPQWYARIHSEALVREMAGLGVNLAITHFFKGFGLKHEQAEQQRTAELVQFAHRHGMRVLGYCQSRSLYYEAFLDEEPGAEDWIQRDQLGQKIAWGGSYFRWAPCVNSREFRDYMKRVITHGLKDIGLDGLHFDNDYAQPCYCRRCEQAFRQWLAGNCREPRNRFGLENFQHVRLPPQQEKVGRIQDPLVQAWVRWRCESLGDYHRELTEHARSLRPDVILLANPAHPRSLDAPYKRSVWAPLLGRHLTLMFAENSNCAGLEQGLLVSQIRAYKQAAAVGYRVVSTTWRRNSETGLGLPDKPADVVLVVAEAAAFGGIPGTNWALRPDGDGDRMRIDHADLRDGLKRYLGFARGNERLMSGARAVRDVAVLQTFASHALDSTYSWPLVLGVEEVLIRHGFSWETLFGDNLQHMNEFGTLVVAGQSHLTDAECAALRAFVGRGGGLLLVGENGGYDEGGRRRFENPLAELRGPRVVRLEERLARVKVEPAQIQHIPLPKGSKQIAAGLEQALAQQWSVRLSGSDVVALAAYETSVGSLAVHLVNYATEPATGLRLSLGPKWRTARRARLLSPEDAEQTLTLAGGDLATIALPKLGIYAVLIVETT